MKYCAFDPSDYREPLNSSFTLARGGYNYLIMRILSGPASSWAYRQPFIVNVIILSRRKFINRQRGTIGYDVQLDQIPHRVIGQQKQENEPSCLCPDVQIHPDSLLGLWSKSSEMRRARAIRGDLPKFIADPKLQVSSVKLRQNLPQILELESDEFLEWDTYPVKMDRRDSKQVINQPPRFSKQFVCYSQARQLGVRFLSFRKKKKMS